MKKHILFASLGLICLSLYSCRSSDWEKFRLKRWKWKKGKVAVFAQGFSRQLDRYEDDLYLVDPLTGNIQLYGAGNEKIYFKLIIPQQNVNKIKIKFTGLKSSIGKFNIDPTNWTVYRLIQVKPEDFDALASRMHPVPVDERKILDALVKLIPRNNIYEFKKQNEDIYLLCELTVPENVPYGKFVGNISVWGGNKEFSRKVILTSCGRNLPKIDSNVFAILDLAKLWEDEGFGKVTQEGHLILPPNTELTEEFAQIVGKYVKILTTHNIQPIAVGIYPQIKLLRNGKITINLKQYIQIVNAIIRNTTKPIKFWVLPISMHFPSTKQFGPYNGKLYQKAVGLLLKELQNKVLSTGLVGKGIFLPELPESYLDAKEVFARYSKLAKIVHILDKDILIVSPFIPSDLRMYGWRNFEKFEGIDFAKIWIPEEYWVSEKTVEKLKNAGKTVLWRPDSLIGNYYKLKPYYPAGYSYIPVWANLRYNLDGVIIGRANSYGRIRGEKILNEALILPGEWFGVNLPIETIRLKYIYDSIQHLRYLELLSQANEREFVDSIGQKLIRFFCTDGIDGTIWSTNDNAFCEDNSVWDIIKPLMCLKLVASQDNTSIRAKLAVLRSRFESKTSFVKLDFLGVKLKNQFDPVKEKNRILWNYYFTITNFTQTPVDATLKFSNLPYGTSDVKEAKIENLLPLIPLRKKISYTTQSTGFNVYGVGYMPVSLQVKGNTLSKVSCRYCAIHSTLLEYPIKIDGNLSDWPDRPSAIIGNFTKALFSSICPDRNIPPKYQTEVRIATDEQNLYISAICYQPGETIKVNLSNTIPISCGLPFGEDMFVIFIDPTNSVSENVEKIYTIVIKPNGACASFKGSVISHILEGETDHNLSPSVHTRIFKDRWTLELAIPLKELTDEEDFNRWWGMDFIRVTTNPPEISSWTGVYLPCGKPVTLGNVLIQSAKQSY